MFQISMGFEVHPLLVTHIRSFPEFGRSCLKVPSNEDCVCWGFGAPYLQKLLRPELLKLSPKPQTLQLLNIKPETCMLLPRKEPPKEPPPEPPRETF